MTIDPFYPQKGTLLNQKTWTTISTTAVINITGKLCVWGSTSAGLVSMSLDLGQILCIAIPTHTNMVLEDCRYSYIAVLALWLLPLVPYGLQ